MLLQLSKHLISNKQGRQSVIVDRIGYDKDGHTVYTKLGNGTETTYTYDKQRERLQIPYSRQSDYDGKIINKEDISVKSIIAKILISKELMYIFPSSYLNSQLPQDNGGQ